MEMKSRKFKKKEQLFDLPFISEVVSSVECCLPASNTKILNVMTFSRKVHIKLLFLFINKWKKWVKMDAHECWKNIKPNENQKKAKLLMLNYWIECA